MKRLEFLFFISLTLIAHQVQCEALTVSKLIQEILESSYNCVISVVGDVSLFPQQEIQWRQPHILYGRTPSTSTSMLNIQFPPQDLHYLNCLVSLNMAYPANVPIVSLTGVVSDNRRGGSMTLSTTVYFNFMKTTQMKLAGRMRPPVGAGPVYLFPYESDVDGALQVGKGYFLCHYCKNSKLYAVTLYTGKAMSILKQLASDATGKGRNILWFDANEVMDNFQLKDCWKYGRSCSRKPLENVLQQYVMSPFESSIMKERRFAYTHPVVITMIRSGPCFSDTADLMYIGEAPRNNMVLITSDSVHQEEMPLEKYLLPFSLFVWKSILCCAIILVIGLSLTIRKDPQGLFLRILKTSLWILRMLVGQRDSSPLPEYTGKDFPQSKRIVIGGWLLTALALRTLYQVFIPAKHFEPRTSTPWMELEYMRGFTLYVPIEINESDCAIVIDTVRDMKSNGYGREIVQYFCVAAETREEFYDICRTVKKLAMVMLDPHITTLFVCAQDVPQIISNELTRPRTALITWEAEFSRYWAMVQAFMRANQTTKFAPNFARTYEESQENPHLCVRTNLGRLLYQNIIHVRIAATISSGVFQWWQRVAEESEQRLQQARQTPVDWKESHLSPLTFLDVSLLYYICGLILAASVVIFLLESITWAIRSRRRVNREPLTAKMDTIESDAIPIRFTQIISLIRWLAFLKNKK